MVVSNQHDDASEHRTQDDIFHFRRLQGVGDEHLQRVVPTHDVDLLVAEFAGDVLDSRTANAHAGPHGVNVVVDARDRDLRAISRLARQRPHLDHALADFRNLQLEQATNEFDMRAGQDDLHATPGFPHFQNGGSHPIADAVALARNLFAARQQPLRLAEADDRRPALDLGHGSGHDLIAELGVFVVQGVPFRLANLLDHHLFGGLSRNSPEQIAQRIGINGLPVRLDRRVAVTAIDVNLDLIVFAEVLARGRQDRLLDALEHDLLVDALVAMNRVHDAKQLGTVHFNLSPCPIFDGRRTNPTCRATRNARCLTKTETRLQSGMNLPGKTQSTKKVGTCPTSFPATPRRCNRQQRLRLAQPIAVRNDRNGTTISESHGRGPRS